MTLRTEFAVARERFGKTLIEFIDTESVIDTYLADVDAQTPADIKGRPYKVTRQISDWEKVL